MQITFECKSYVFKNLFWSHFWMLPVQWRRIQRRVKVEGVCPIPLKQIRSTCYFETFPTYVSYRICRSNKVSRLIGWPSMNRFFGHSNLVSINLTWSSLDISWFGSLRIMFRDFWLWRNCKFFIFFRCWFFYRNRVWNVIELIPPVNYEFSVTWNI